MSAITVVVATCNRPTELAECLASLVGQTHGPESIVVVDDAPGGDLTPAVVARFAPRARYVAGARGGLADAHNRALAHVTTPLVAFTDDDVLADRRWLERIVDAFASGSDVACVTGLILPLELQTPAQVLLEGFAGYGKGGRRQAFDLHANRPADPLFPLTAGRMGSGANMAFSRRVLEESGGFDAALGAGTLARGGDDLCAFFEVVQRGHTLVYEPGAIVLHRHAEELPALKRQVYGYGVGLTAYLTRSLVKHPRLIPLMLWRLPAALRHVLAPDSPKNDQRPPGYPRTLVHLELLGMLRGPFAYAASRRVRRSAA